MKLSSTTLTLAVAALLAAVSSATPVIQKRMAPAFSDDDLQNLIGRSLSIESDEDEVAFFKRASQHGFQTPGLDLSCKDIKPNSYSPTNTFCKGKSTILYGAADYNIDNYTAGNQYGLIYCSGMIQPFQSLQLNTYFVPMKAGNGPAKVDVLSNITPNNLPEDIATSKSFSYKFNVTVPHALGMWYYIIEEVFTIPGKGQQLGKLYQRQSYPVIVVDGNA